MPLPRCPSLSCWEISVLWKIHCRPQLLSAAISSLLRKNPLLLLRGSHDTTLSRLLSCLAHLLKLAPGRFGFFPLSQTLTVVNSGSSDLKGDRLQNTQKRPEQRTWKSVPHEVTPTERSAWETQSLACLLCVVDINRNHSLPNCPGLVHKIFI